MHFRRCNSDKDVLGSLLWGTFPQTLGAHYSIFSMSLNLLLFLYSSTFAGQDSEAITGSVWKRTVRQMAVIIYLEGSACSQPCDT